MHRTAFALLALAAACPAADDNWGAKLKLISENATIAPGQPFEVGVLIHHREGHHSYWKNPGVVGFATQIEWDLPEGFEAGPIVWPVPEIVDMAGHAAHGYHRDVLLTVTLTPPAELEESEITLGARIAWMACSDACHPGDEPFSLTLPVAEKASTDPDTAPLFEKTRAARPGPLPGWKAELLSEPDAAEIRLRLTRTADDAPLLEKPYFFSTDGQVADGTPRLEKSDDGALLLTFARAEHGPDRAEGLPGLIAWGSHDARKFGLIAP